MLQYHWQHFKIQDSGVTLKTTALRDLNPDTKPDITPSGNELWKRIRTPAPMVAEFFLAREIGVFLKNLKEEYRKNAGRKKDVNLKAQAKAR